MRSTRRSGRALEAIEWSLSGYSTYSTSRPSRAQRNEELLVVGRRAAQVALALQDHQRRVHVRHVPQRRLAPERLDPLGRERLAQALLGVVDVADVAVRVGRDLVGDAVRRDGRGEPVGRSDQPVDHEPAVAVAVAAQPLGVGQPGPDQVVEHGVAVGVVHVSPGPVQRRDPLAPLVPRSPDVRPSHPVPGADQHVVGGVGRIRPRPGGAAVDVQDGRHRPVPRAGRRQHERADRSGRALHDQLLHHRARPAGQPGVARSRFAAAARAPAPARTRRRRRSRSATSAPPPARRPRSAHTPSGSAPGSTSCTSPSSVTRQGTLAARDRGSRSAARRPRPACRQSSPCPRSAAGRSRHRPRAIPATGPRPWAGCGRTRCRSACRPGRTRSACTSPGSFER